MLENYEVLDRLGMLNSPNVFDGNFLEICDQLLPNGLADLLGMELLEL